MGTNISSKDLSVYIPDVGATMGLKLLIWDVAGQQLFYDRTYACTCLDREKDSPDLVALAEAFGAKGIRVVDPDLVEAAIAEAIEADCPVIIDFRVEPEENVYPMVAPGAPLYDMIGDMLYPVEKIHPEKAEEPFL